MPTYTLTVAQENNGLRLDVFLAKSIPEAPSRSFIQKLITSKETTVNGEFVKSNYKVACGDEVKINFDLITADDLKAENIPLDIFYEDEVIIVVNKPTGMLVHPASGRYTKTLVNALLYHSQSLSNINQPFRPGIVHRLDEDTSGLIVIAKTNLAHAQLAKQFEEHVVYKCYVALVEGIVEFDEGFIDAPLARHPRNREKRSVAFHEEAKEARTTYRVLERFKTASLVALFPQTGRTHQLRVHMAHLKHPILGDGKYGHKNSFSRLALHAQSIGFVHPNTLHYIEFCSVIPEEFRKNI